MRKLLLILILLMAGCHTTESRLETILEPIGAPPPQPAPVRAEDPVMVSVRTYLLKEHAPTVRVALQRNWLKTYNAAMFNGPRCGIWRQAQGLERGDLNLDGRYDAEDLALLSAEYWE